MRKAIYISTLVLSLFILNPSPARAGFAVSEASGQLKSQSVDTSFDYRVETLKNYLEKYNSPLAEYASKLVEYADTYGLDYRLLAAISGAESTFGKRIPKNSYNAYGWANGNYAFASWDNSIEVVSKALRQKYIEKGAVSISQIAKRYAPPSNTWSNKVKHIMKRIDPLPVSFSIEI